MSTTFNVAKVKPTTESPKQSPFSSQLAEHFGTLVVSSDPDVQVVNLPCRNMVLLAAHLAFADHHPLTLSPDIVWTVIAQGFAQHISLNPEQYRKCFVAHEGKLTLEYLTGAAPGSPTLPWSRVIEIFAEKVREKIGSETRDLIVCNFSTTGPLEKTVSEVVLLDAMQSYFKYLGGTMCGIPSITLEGTVEDWQALRAKVTALAAYGGLDWWLDKVAIIADQCVAAQSGKVDQAFWNDIYKIKNQSGGPYVNGWLTHLLPYTVNVRTGERAQNKTLNPAPGTDREWGGGGITDSMIPGSVSTVPFTWSYYGNLVNYQFIAGALGVTCDPTTFALRPKLGWAIRKVEPEAAKS